MNIVQENSLHRGKYHCTAYHLFDWLGFDQTSKTVVNRVSIPGESKPNKQNVSRTWMLHPTVQAHHTLQFAKAQVLRLTLNRSVLYFIVRMKLRGHFIH